jgi:hypothetical protein
MLERRGVRNGGKLRLAMHDSRGLSEAKFRSAKRCGKEFRRHDLNPLVSFLIDGVLNAVGIAVATSVTRDTLTIGDTV